MIRVRRLFLIPAVLGLAAAPSSAGDARIQVRFDQVRHRLTRYMTGACIEDVNHEIYGGIYSQLIFGESFQEPAAPPSIRGFRAFGGDWSVSEGVVSAGAGPGPKLISEMPVFGSGAVGVELYLPGDSGGVAGLIVNVREPGAGMDRFIGYEVSLDSRRKVMVLGRHRQNWEPIRDVPCEVPADRWISLEVRLAPRKLTALVDGKTVADYEDRDHPLEAGTFGLRPFQRACRYRGLWTEIDGRKRRIPFEADARWDEGVSGMWRGLRRGSANGSFALETREPFAGRHSQRLELHSGEGEIGIENRGLNRWGLSLSEQKLYEGYVWLRAEKPAAVYAALESGDGSRVYAEERLAVEPGGWKRLELTLTPQGTDRAGRFALKLKEPASVAAGHAFLQPGSWGRFKDLPLRRDVVEGLIEQGLTVLRYGGSMVNHAEYRWKTMIGPRDRRPPYRGTWYPHSTNGWGILDFLDLCEAAGFLAIPAFNMDETPEDMADFMEYVNGAAESPWGSRRAAGGRPAPYRLRHVELGNEEKVDEAYWRRFRPMAEAMWAKDPSVILVVGDFAFDKPFEDPSRVSGAASGITTLEAHRKILDLARERGREVWFDVHVWNEEPRQPDGLGGVPSFLRALGELSPGASYQVAVFELNANRHGMGRALGNAHAINELERLSGLVPVVCSANCLQPYRQNDNGWDQGLLFLTPSQVWGQPPYYITQMLARRWLPLCIAADFESAGNALDVTAKKSEDGKVLQLQVVNVDGEAVAAEIVVEGFSPARPAAQLAELSGGLGEVNTPEEPRRILPRESEWAHGLRDGRTRYTFPPRSFTILRFE